MTDEAQRFRTRMHAPSVRRAVRLVGPLALALIIGSASEAAAQDRAALENGCALRRVASLPMSGLEHNRLYVPATIRTAEIEMRLDTEAWVSAVSNDVVQRLDLPTRDSLVPLPGVQGFPLKTTASVAELRLGAVASGLLQLPVIEDKAGEALLGNDILSQYDVEIDPAASAVRLYSKAHCPGQVVHWATEYHVLPFRLTDDRLLQVSATLDGQSVRAVLATGSTGTLVTAAAANRAGYHSGVPTEQVVTPNAGFGALPTFRHQFGSLVLADIKISNPALFIREGPVIGDGVQAGLKSFRLLTHDPIEMLIGLNLLKNFHLYIAYDEGKLYFTPK